MKKYPKAGRLIGVLLVEINGDISEFYSSFHQICVGFKTVIPHFWYKLKEYNDLFQIQRLPKSTVWRDNMGVLLFLLVAYNRH